jgi:hypothetical protein
VLRRELRTPLGIFAPGCVFDGKRTAAGWLLELLPTVDGGPKHPATVPAGDAYVARKRQKLTNADSAHAEYEFARATVGLSHIAALAWLMERFDVTGQQLDRWGLTGRAAS